MKAILRQGFCGWRVGKSKMITALLAVDVGGSTSRATLVDYSGTCLGQARSGGGNPGSNPPDAAAAAIIAAAGAAVSRRQDAALDIRVAMLAVAGPRSAEVERRLNEAFRAMVTHRAAMVMTGDTPGHAAFRHRGARRLLHLRGHRFGCRAGRTWRGLNSVVDAVGYLIGDLGSGYWLGHHAAIAVAAALEGRGPKTALSRSRARQPGHSQRRCCALPTGARNPCATS